MTKKVAYIFIPIILFFIGFEIAFRLKKYKNTAFSNKIWIHQVNSYELLNKVVSDVSIEGIEIDLFYINNHFYVSHELPASNMILLADFLKKIPKEFNLWFDLKNLNSKNYLEVIQKYNQLDQIYNLKARSFIESQNGLLLREISLKGIQTLFWVYPYPNSRAHYFYNLKNKFIILFSDFNGVSFDYTHIDYRVDKTYEKIPKYLFTVNSKEKIKELSHNPNVKVILTDLL